MSAVKGTSFQLPPPQASLFFFLLGAVKLSLSLSSLFGGRVHRVIWEKAVLCQCALNELVEERVFFVFPSRFALLSLSHLTMTFFVALCSKRVIPAQGCPG